MAREIVTIDGQQVETLQELLKPGLRAIFIGINPSPVSVEAGHYYQGKLGKAFWGRLQRHGLMGPLLAGAEDEAAHKAGFGFADLVRKPTSRAHGLSDDEKKLGGNALAARLMELPDRPLVIFVFKQAEEYSAALLHKAGFATELMPAPYAERAVVEEQMAKLAALIGQR